MHWGAHSKGALRISGCQENGTDGRDIKAEDLLMKKSIYSFFFFFKREENILAQSRGKMERGLLGKM